MDAQPFVKWVGGKRQLLSQYALYFPPAPGFTRYLEPFVGGGAVFFHLWNTKRLPDALGTPNTPNTPNVFLLDNNEELINAYRAVRDDPDELIRLLAIHEKHHNKEYYYRVRKLDRQYDVQLTPIQRASRTLYLNKTCFNGLYRVNRKGQFNSPMGRYTNPKILPLDVLRAAHTALQGIHIGVGDFREVVDMAQPGDFFYLDPPYDPLNKTASFTGYTARGFGDLDQQDLAAVFTTLSQRGCLCMLSNSYTPFILDLYQSFRIEVVYAKRAISSKASTRGAIKEVVILNY